MQLNHKKLKLSLIVSSILLQSSLNAQDYVRVNYMQYNENDNRVSIKAPTIEINKDFGVDYTLNASFVYDSVSGASPIYSDTTSGASAFHRGDVNNTQNIKKQNVQFSEGRSNSSISLVKRLKNRDEVTLAYSKSYESDYDANTISIDYLHWANSSKNRSYNIGVSYALNKILIKNGASDDDSDSSSGASKKENSNTIASEIGMTQIINRNSLAKVTLFYSKEDGYLTNPYYNIVRDGSKVVAENRPSLRTAYGFNLKYIKAFKSNFTSKFKYKFYTDDWDIVSHTIDINNYYEINKKYIFGFGLRYYTQSKASFYSGDKYYFTNQKYASMDDRLSSFDAKTYKFSLDYKYNNKISYNISANIYDQSTGLKAVYQSVGVKYKF